MRGPATSVLRLWLAASAVALAGLAVWAFAPVLVFVLLLTGALGLVSALMIRIARGLQDRRARRDL